MDRSVGWLLFAVLQSILSNQFETHAFGKPKAEYELAEADRTHRAFWVLRNEPKGLA